MKTLKNIWDKTIGSLLIAALVGLIRGYQIMISPRLGPVCRYYPSCSHYGLEAVKVHGAAKGSLLAALRIARCHPWAEGGFDYVPEKNTWRSTKVIEISTNKDRQVIG